MNNTYMINDEIKYMLYLKKQRKITNKGKKFIMTHLKKAIEDHKTIKSTWKLSMRICRNKKPSYTVYFETERKEKKEDRYDLKENIEFDEKMTDVRKFYNLDFEFWYAGDWTNEPKSIYTCD